ncbi:MAG TPA: hypothetical protein VFX89_14355 [Gammaproteobacteria bacterium]|nr:hypothetical protein [Gammaproteobacteria bacterium]
MQALFRYFDRLVPLRYSTRALTVVLAAWLGLRWAQTGSGGAAALVAAALVLVGLRDTLQQQRASPQMNNAVSAFTAGMRQLRSTDTASVRALAQTALQRYLGFTPTLDRSLTELLVRYASTQDAMYAMYEESRALFALALRVLRDAESRREQAVARIST